MAAGAVGSRRRRLWEEGRVRGWEGHDAGPKAARIPVKDVLPCSALLCYAAESLCVQRLVLHCGMASRPCPAASTPTLSAMYAVLCSAHSCVLVYRVSSARVYMYLTRCGWRKGERAHQCSSPLNREGSPSVRRHLLLCPTHSWHIRNTSIDRARWAIQPRNTSTASLPSSLSRRRVGHGTATVRRNCTLTQLTTPLYRRQDIALDPPRSCYRHCAPLELRHKLRQRCAVLSLPTAQRIDAC